MGFNMNRMNKQKHNAQFVIRPGERGDISGMLALIRELAVYERAEGEVVVTESQLAEDGFGKNPVFESFVAEINGEIAGMALFYTKYSTWKGKCIYLEDLIVREPLRRLGIGSALFEAVVELAARRRSGRLEWQVLNWNTPAIRFYEKYNPVFDDEWINGKLVEL
jgi:GNAT superfamily N-acetyltransferase